eukprot:9533156-Prorocentrum_lima.AAC.1
MLCEMAHGSFLFNPPEATELFAAVELITNQMGSREAGHAPGQGDPRIQEGSQQQQQQQPEMGESPRSG